MFKLRRRKKKSLNWQPTQKDIDERMDDFFKRGGTVEKIDITDSHNDFVERKDTSDNADSFLLNNNHSPNHLSL